MTGLQLTLRKLWRNRLFTALNIIGLAIGISACWIIYRIVDYEMSYDKAHPDANRIYQVVGRFKANGKESGFGGVPLPLAPTLGEGVKGVEMAVPLYRQYVETLTVPAVGNVPARKIEEPAVVATSQDYFDMVPYHWIAGNKQGCLDGPDKVVLTVSRAAAYFPGMSPQRALGKTLLYDSIPRIITGIIGDLHYPSSFEEKEFIAVPLNEWTSDNWLGSNSNHLLFIKVTPGASAREIVDFVTKKREDIVGEEQKEYGFEASFEALPLLQKHFAAEYATSSRSASMNVLYGLMGIGFFLLILACINYINLSTAQIPQRAKEIGIRKTLGSTPKRLISNFLAESLIITLMSAVLAFPMVNLFLRVFPDFVPEGMTTYTNIVGLTIFLTLLVFIIALASGSYPAWLVTKVQTTHVLKGQGDKIIPTSRLNLRKILIVFQFVVAQVFIASVIIVHQQLHYTLNKDLGFEYEAVVNITMPYRSEQGGNIDPFIYKHALARHSDIAGVALGHAPLNDNHWGTQVRYATDTGEVRVEIPRKYIDPDYLGLYQIKLLAGTNIQQTDTLRDLLINDAARKVLGFTTPQAAVGKLVTMQGKQYPIVGVTADFHQKSLHVAIEPLLLAFSKNRSSLQTFHVKLPPERNRWSHVISLLEQEWKAIYPNTPFEYRFNDERIKSLYESEHRTAKLIQLATGITLFISCLGLFGLATLTAFQRTKEIGIRKVLGASIYRIVALLSRDFVKLILIAAVIASPIAWWAMNKWLEDFAYRINIGWWIFTLAGSTAILIALLTVSYQAIRAARANPVDSLRNE